MKERYPKIFLDSRKITELRKTAQKPFSKDEPVAFIMLRPFTLYISYFLFKKTQTTANSVTNVMAVLAFLFSFLVLLTQNLSQLLLIGLVFYLIYALDLIDGELARLRQQTSEIGKIVDASLWFTLTTTLVLYIYKICTYLGFPELIWQLYLIVSLLNLFTMMVESYHSVDRADTGRAQGKISVKFLLILTSSPLLIYLYMPFALLLPVEYQIFYMGLVVSLYLVRLMITTVVKLITIMRSYPE